MEKTCKKCNKVFKKKYHRSVKSFSEAKFCSRKCKIVSEETKEKLREYKMEKNSRWQGGISKVVGYKRMMCSKRRALKIINGGYHTLGEWELLKEQYNFTCPRCHNSEPFINQKTENLTVDHIIPISKGGSNNIENIQPLCYKCNVEKNTKIIKYIL